MRDNAMHFASRTTLPKAGRPKGSATAHPNATIRSAIGAWIPGPRAQIGVGVIVAHAVVICVLVSSTAVRRGSVRVEEPLHADILLTNNASRRSEGILPLVLDTVVLQDPTDPSSSLPALPVIQYDKPNVGASLVAPQLLDQALPPSAAFARQGGLLPGERALVVVRLEILPGGRVGGAEVDVSSGSWQVDDAAIAYARTLVWIPGRVDDMEESTWVRFGVQLVA